jgi:hypothetical protein
VKVRLRDPIEESLSLECDCGLGAGSPSPPDRTASQRKREVLSGEPFTFSTFEEKRRNERGSTGGQGSTYLAEQRYRLGFEKMGEEALRQNEIGSMRFDRQHTVLRDRQSREDQTRVLPKFPATPADRGPTPVDAEVAARRIEALGEIRNHCARTASNIEDVVSRAQEMQAVDALAHVFRGSLKEFDRPGRPAQPKRRDAWLSLRWPTADIH